MLNQRDTNSFSVAELSVARLGCSWLRLRISVPLEKCMSVSCECIVLYRSETGRSLFQRSPTDWCVLLCVIKCSCTRRGRYKWLD